MQLRRGLKLLSLGTALLAASWVAAAENNHPTYTDPAQAGPEFEVQGEYKGSLGDSEKHP